MLDESKISIDGGDYVVEVLPKDALDQLPSIIVVDRKIADLQQDIAILQSCDPANRA